VRDYDESTQMHATRTANYCCRCRTYSKALLLSAIAGLVFGCGGGSGPAPALVSDPNSATLAWDASPSPSVIGYRVYFGTVQGGPYSQAPGQGVDVGFVTSYTVNGLTSGTTYYFVATAYDFSQNESGYSNEVSKAIP
jgi:hypothetical protein